ncbi:MAG: EAL domain-containing protein [Planctomycetota bacterium]
MSSRFSTPRSHEWTDDFRPRPVRGRWLAHLRHNTGNTLVTAIACLSVLVLTIGSVVYLNQSGRATDAQRFNLLKEKLSSEIARRVNMYRYGLMGTRSVFVASEQVQRAEFRQIIASRDMPTEFPAATGMGYIQRVGVSDLDAFLDETRRDDAPDYRVRMLADRVTHDDLYIIKYIEPESANRAAIGLDIGQEARRRRAADLAMRCGDAVLTDPITLVQATGSGPGFLILLPHYREGMPVDSEAQRVEALEGWVYMTILADKVFANAAHSIDRELDFNVFHNASVAEDALLYGEFWDPRTGARGGLRSWWSGPRLVDSVQVEIGGQDWTLVMHSTDRFDAESRAGMWTAGVGGCLVTGFIVAFMQLQSNSLKKAQHIAASMTADLRMTAMTDRLTGLPNRAAIIDRVQDAIHRASRLENYHYAVLFLDFDRFKIINDSLGHAAGDMLLREISRRLGETLRPHDAAGYQMRRETAARLGGDEFIVLLDGMKHKVDAVLVTERLLAVLSKPYQLGSRQVVSTASIGVVCGGPEYTEAADMIRDADTAMYEAKNAGCGSFKVFDAAMRTRATERLNIENDLHTAVELGEFVLEYQPILKLENGGLESFEALVRWEHPEQGRIGPDRFIPIAEETGIIVPIGRWVLHQALRDFSLWRNENLIDDTCCISVNLSRKQLILPSLFDDVTLALRKHGVPARCLHLEVTESQIMQDRDFAVDNLRRLRRAGVQIDIDDFGTGYSSLACLHEFPIDILKIDRSFIANLEEDASLVTVLQTVIELARHLGIRVVAEGGENDAQIELLRSLACDCAQGYRFSRPIAQPMVVEYCEKRRGDKLRLAA